MKTSLIVIAMLLMAAQSYAAQSYAAQSYAAGEAPKKGGMVKLSKTLKRPVVVHLNLRGKSCRTLRVKMGLGKIRAKKVRVPDHCCVNSIAVIGVTGRPLAKAPLRGKCLSGDTSVNVFKAKGKVGLGVRNR